MISQKGQIKILLGLLILVLVGFFLAYWRSQELAQSKNSLSPLRQFTPIPSPTPQFKTYTSSFMKFSIQVPSILSVKEQFTSLTISDKGGVINMNRNGTNFDNLEEYLNELTRLNHLTIKNKHELAINGLSADTYFVSDENTYFIYADHEVFAFSTSSPALYSDLDEIAKSFKYNP